MRATPRLIALSGALALGSTALVAMNTTASASGSRTAEAPAVARAAAGSDAAKIANAMSAAPRALARKAAVMDYPSSPDGELVLLRKGTNGWTCLPDDRNTPGNDPICFDEHTAGWVQAWLSHRTPKLSAPGIAYMLRGASDASNTDPYAVKPATGNDWMTSGPHVMFFPNKTIAKGSYTTDPHNGGPWVMWAGTPYAHFMVPTTSGRHGGQHMAMGGSGGAGG
jgi:hypothetical protein